MSSASTEWEAWGRFLELPGCRHIWLQTVQLQGAGRTDCCVTSTPKSHAGHDLGAITFGSCGAKHRDVIIRKACRGVVGSEAP